MKSINNKIRMTFIALLGAIMSMVSTSVRADNTLKISDANVGIGSSVILPVNMNNTDQISGVQFDIYLPTGISVPQSGGDYQIDINTGRTSYSKHSIFCSKQSDGAIRVNCFSMTNASFSGNTGTIIDITLKASENLAEGNYQVSLKNIELTSKEGAVFTPSLTSAALRVINGVDMDALKEQIHSMSEDINNMTSSCMETLYDVEDLEFTLNIQEGRVVQLQDANLTKSDREALQIIANSIPLLKSQIESVKTQMQALSNKSFSLYSNIVSINALFSTLQSMVEEAQQLTGDAKIQAEMEIKAMYDEIEWKCQNLQTEISKTNESFNECMSQIDAISEAINNNQTALSQITPIEPSTDNTLTINDDYAPLGGQYVLPIIMQNQDNITGFQFDLYLPENISIAEAEGELKIDLNETRSSYKKHAISYAIQPDGAVRIVCTSMSNAVFSGNDGAVINITLNMPEEPGQMQVTIANIELTTPDAELFRPSESKALLSTFKAGDANLDNIVDVADVTTVAQYILGQTPENIFLPAADANQDGVVDIADITKIASIILLK